MTMSGDMSIVLHDEINSVLGPQARAKWEEHCLELEIASFPRWKRACELWNQPGWISKRVSLAVESRAEIARQQAFAPAMVAPTMAMSLNDPVTIDLPTHVLEPEPISPPSSQASPQSSQPQTGELAAELTPDAALVQPIAELSLPADLSGSETTLTIVSPRPKMLKSPMMPRRSELDAAQLSKPCRRRERSRSLQTQYLAVPKTVPLNSLLQSMLPNSRCKFLFLVT